MALVALDEELANLTKIFGRSLEGRGAVAVVSGPMATGKTTLLNALVDHATRPGVLVLSAVGVRAERALMFGVADQLLCGVTGRLEGVNDIETLTLTETVRTLRESTARDQCDALLKIAERIPIMVCVDDVQHADTASLRLLARLARRLRLARVMMVLSLREYEEPVSPLLHAELVQLPHCHRVRLAPLSVAGVARLMGTRLDAGRTATLSEEFHRITGGNPWLLQALIDDGRAAARSGGHPRHVPVVGDCYRQAIMSCLHRGEPRTLMVARALAVLGDSAVQHGCRYLGLSADAVTQRLHGLTMAGVLDSGRFRHEAARLAVLREIAPQERSRLHRLAARTLLDEGADVCAVADQLVAADEAVGAEGAERTECEPWAASVLRQAAALAVAGGRPTEAVRILKVAYRVCADEPEQAVVKAALVKTEWRADPARAVSHLSELAAVVAGGTAVGRPAIDLVRYLLWYGRLAEASEMVRSLDGVDAVAGEGPETIAELDINRILLPVLCPLLSADTQVGEAGWQRRADIAVAVTNPQLMAAGVLRSVLTRGPDSEAVSDAEQVLQRFRQHDAACGAAVAALIALIYADGLTQALAWCDRLLRHDEVRVAPTWQALLMAARAEISVRMGDLAGAEEQGRAALARMPALSWGVALGFPLASLLQAATGMGRYEESEDLLSVPAPKAMFQTPAGLHYLQARGHFYLATDRAEAALGDFLACGELMGRWGIDVPTVAPWRADAAAALLRLGRPAEARKIMDEQMVRRGIDRPSRTRGICLRLLAETSEPQQRVPLLHEAVDILEACGDRLELARGLAALSETHRMLGDPGAARMMLRRASHLAAECRAEPLLRSLQPGRNATNQNETALLTAPREEDGGDLRRDLSNAELRVAGLAAEGYSNREISGKLFITVSTVEQHLTKVYRKLSVSRRVDLSRILKGTATSVG